MRILILSHGHPAFSKGGAELAAYHLYQGINQTPGNKAWFVGRADDKLLHLGSPLAIINENEYLISGHAGIEHLTATIPLGVESDFANLLREIKPDIVHFHHYTHLGVEMLRAVRNILPQAKIIVTLHEFWAICMNYGQMVKKDGRLCYSSSPRECHLCFPDKSPEDFFLRERYIKTFFHLVDKFISPSEFLKNRYVAWGMESTHIEVIENGLPEEGRIPPRTLSPGEIRGRFAYFGQINPFKGVDLILEAITLLPKAVRQQISLDIYGSALNNQEEEYQEKIQDLLKKLKGTVRLHGPYEPQEMGRLMAQIDWVVMGSIWWENSPLVIQEAYKYGRPVICPDIGGMAEKVVPGVGGLHFRARDSLSLTDLIGRLTTDATIFERLHGNLPTYSTIGKVVDDHFKLYATIR